MKIKIILAFFISFICSLSAQNATFKRLDINNVHLYLQNIGNLVYAKGGYWMQLPQDSTIVFDQGPWLIGKINNKISGGYVEWFTYPSSCFSPGPIINGKPAMEEAPQDSNLYRIYKISNGDGTSNPDYANWPKNFGAPVNLDGSPKLYGDQSLWTVYNAFEPNTISRVQWNKRRNDSLYVMPVEIQQLVYARKGNSADDQDIFSNTVFEEFTIINKSNANIDSVYFSLWTDIDIDVGGVFPYNLPACDSTLDLGYCWDTTGHASYHPAVGYALLYGPLVSSAGGKAIFKGKVKNDYKNLSMTAFHGISDDADPGPPANPAFNTTEAWNIARGFYTDGKTVIDPTTGKPTKYTWCGDPVTNTGWLFNVKPGGGAGFNIFSGPFTIAPNDMQWVMIALVPALGKDYKESVSILRNKVELLRSTPYDSIAFGKNPLLVDVKENKSIQPASFVLFQNYPNPFNPTTTIKFSIPVVETRYASTLQHTMLKVYDVLGREVATLVNEEKSPGYYEVKFDGSNLSSGVYFYRLQAGSFNRTKKFVLIK